MKPKFVAPTFDVANLDNALRYYKEVMGFTEDFRYGEYAGISFGDIRLHLSGHHRRPPGGGAAYVFCDEVNDYYAEITRKGAVTTAPPQDQPYGMRDFMSVDPDGNQLGFGNELPES